VGTRALSVDGEEVAGTAGTTSVFSSRTELSFVADAWAGRVVVERAGGEMRYECLVRAPGEAAEMAVAEENSPGGGGSAGSAADLAAKLRVNVIEAGTGRIVHSNIYEGERQSGAYIPGSGTPVPMLGDLASGALQDAVDQALDDPSMRAQLGVGRSMESSNWQPGVI
jgi:hypothetical protein